MLCPPRLAMQDRETVAHTLNVDPLGYGAILALETTLQAMLDPTHQLKAVAVSSGTAALHLALRAVGVGPGDEVLVPTLTFAGAAAAVMYCGAWPHFVDCSFSPIGALPVHKLSVYLNSLSKEQRTRIKAVIAVDLLGHPSINTELQYLCAAMGYALVEDAAGALGSVCDAGHCGALGNVAAVSFNCNKIVTTGGGGAVLSNDAALIEHVRDMATTAKVPSSWAYEHHSVGYNYRLPNVCAALGVGQLGRIEEKVAQKWGRNAAYMRAFEGMDGVQMVSSFAGARPNHWLSAIMIDPRYVHDAHALRLETMKRLQGFGIESRELYTPLHLQKPYEDCPRQGNLEIATDLWRRVICLPS